MQKKSPMGHSIVFNCCGILVPFLSASEGHPQQARAPREALLIAVILAATTILPSAFGLSSMDFLLWS